MTLELSASAQVAMSANWSLGTLPTAECDCSQHPLTTVRCSEMLDLGGAGPGKLQPSRTAGEGTARL